MLPKGWVRFFAVFLIPGLLLSPEAEAFRAPDLSIALQAGGGKSGFQEEALVAAVLLFPRALQQAFLGQREKRQIAQAGHSLLDVSALSTVIFLGLFYLGLKAMGSSWHAGKVGLNDSLSVAVVDPQLAYRRILAAIFFLAVVTVSILLVILLPRTPWASQIKRMLNIQKARLQIPEEDPALLLHYSTRPGELRAVASLRTLQEVPSAQNLMERILSGTLTETKTVAALQEIRRKVKPRNFQDQGNNLRGLLNHASATVIFEAAVTLVWYGESVSLRRIIENYISGQGHVHVWPENEADLFKMLLSQVGVIASDRASVMWAKNFKGADERIVLLQNPNDKEDFRANFPFAPIIRVVSKTFMRRTSMKWSFELPPPLSIPDEDQNALRLAGYLLPEDTMFSSAKDLFLVLGAFLAVRQIKRVQWRKSSTRFLSLMAALVMLPGIAQHRLQASPHFQAALQQAA